MRFFFYGTLTADSGNQVAKWLHGLLGPGKPATVRGHLFAIEAGEGWYPGLIADPRGVDVHGYLHETTAGFSPDDLAALDRYESFDPLAPECSEFVRREILADTGTQSLASMAYILRVPPDKDIVTIPAGSFSGFIRQHGLRAFGASAR